MKILFTSSCILILLFVACKNKEQKNHVADSMVITTTKTEVADTVKKSIPAYMHNNIGAASFRIHYHSPAVRGRIIWGGLVPYDLVWATGAHTATSIECDKDFIIDGKTIPAGKYAFFTIPGKEEWTVIINKKWDQHLADEYKQEDDLLRMKIKPDTLDYNQERLMYDMVQLSQKDGNILMMWEKLKLMIPLKIAD